MAFKNLLSVTKIYIHCQQGVRFDISSLKEIKRKPSIIMRSENTSMVLFNPPNALETNNQEQQSLKIESEVEPKATPAKIDTTSENLKLLFENWPEGNVVNLDDE